MSQEIDNRIVNMIFNNKQFEEGVSETEESLDKLKKSLDFSNFKSSINNVDLSAIANGVEALTSRFSAFGEFGARIISKFADDVYATTKRLVNEAILQPIKDGYAEYELKMGSVQTILNSALNRSGQAVTLEEVNSQLEELNKYADRTIYSFKDMTANIGKFTNAGVALEDAVAAIQGVSNVAAVSGANANEASRAMYNFAQALSSGYVKLIDWKSIENANMATVEFKTQLLESAVAAGTLEKKADGMYRVLSGTGFKENGVETLISATSHFNDSLSSAWMTTEVLTSTLAKYSDETTEIGKKAFAAATEVKTLSQAWDTLKEAAGSTWAQTWETIFGDLNQSKKLWTRLEQDLEEIFVKGGDKRNELLKQWAELGGRDYLFSTDEDNLGALWNLMDALKQILNVVKSAFKEVFGESNVFRLLKLTYGFQQLTASLVLSGEKFKQVKTLLKGVFSVFKLAGEVVSAVIKPFKQFFEGFSGYYGAWAFFEDLENIGNSLIKFRDSVLQSGVLEKVSNYLGKIYFSIGEILGGMIDTIHYAIRIFKGDAHTFVEIGGNLLKPMTTFQKIISVVFKTIQWTVSEIIAAIAKLFGYDYLTAYDKVYNFFDKIASAILNFRETINKSNIVKKMKDFWASLKAPDNTFLNNILSFWKNFKEYIKGIVEQIHPLQLLKTIFSTLFDFLKTVIHSIGPAIANLGGFIIKVLGGLIDTAGKLIKLFGESLRDGTLGSLLTGGVNIGVGVGLFKTFNNLGSIFETIKKTFDDGGAVNGVIKSITDTFGLMQAKLKAEQLKGIATAIAIMAASLVVLALIDPVRLGAGVLAISSLTKELTVAMKSLASIKIGKSISTAATSLIKMSAAVLVLAAALKIVSSVDPERLGAGLLAVTALLGELVAVVKILGTGKKLNSLKQVGAGLIGMSAALLILAAAVKAFGSIDPKQLEQGLSTVTILLLELTAFVKIAGNTKKMASVGAGLLLVAGAMLEFSGVVAIFGALNEGAWIKGISAFTIILGEMELAMMLFDRLNPGKVAAASASMLLIAGSMLEVSLVLAVLSTIKLEKLAGAIVAFSVTLLEMVGALKVLSGIDPVKLIASAGAMVIMGAALVEMSIALKVLSTIGLGEMLIALGALAVTLTLLGVAAVALGPLAPAMLAVAGAFALFGVGALALGAGLVLVSAGLAAFAGSVAVSMAALLEAIKIGITALPEILAALADSLGKSFKSIVSLIATVIKSICEAIKETVPEIVDTIIVVIDKVLTSIGDHIESIVVQLLKIVVGVLEGLTKGIPEIIESAVNLLKAIFDALKNSLGDMSAETILEAIGIAGLLTVLMTELAALSALALVATLSLPSIGKNLSDFMTNITPFLDGISKVGTETLEGAEALASAILALTVSSILEGITRWITGKSSFESFGKELAAFGPYLKTYNDSIKGISNTNITASAEAVKTMAEMANELPNSGGIVSWFQGDNTLADFGEMLAEFGPHFAKYAASVNGINATAVSTSATAATELANMASGLPNSGGIISWITGDNTLADFGKMLADFGPYLKSYADSVNGLNVAAITSSVGGTNNLVKVANAVAAVDLNSNSGPLTYFGTQVSKMGGNIYSYAAFMEVINWDSVARSVEEINKIADLSDRLELLDTSTLSTFATNISKMATNGINLLITTFTNSYTKVYNKATDVAKRGVSGINSVTPQFATAGANLMQGMINGLNSRAQAVYNTAAAIANRAAQVVRNALQIHSPSRVFEQIGMFVDLGFAQGLTGYADTIESSADIVGRSALDAMAEAVQNAVYTIDHNPEFTPTITPVLDMSYVDDGLGRLGDSFNNSRLSASGFYRTSFDLAGSIADSNRTNQNGGILGMMTQMIDEFASLSEAVENMQIVMDSGVDVGAIAPKMDAALGQRIVYKGRGH